MGVKIFELLTKKEIGLKDLSNKVIMVDASLVLYQFLSSIRQRDGTPLKDSQGNVTSHLIGLFSRTTRLMQNHIKIAYVFDGKAPDLKKKERERRAGLKQEAKVKYEAALKAKDVAGMKKYASRTSKLTPRMVSEAKELISALGLPIIQAPSEGEAQAAYIVKKGDAFALATQDADGFMFGTPRLVKNLTVSEKRKMPGRSAYYTVKPEIFELSNALNNLGIDQSQLIALGMLIGTDYNIGGIKGIGPKNGLKLVKKFGKDFGGLFKEVKWDDYFDFEWRQVYDTIKDIKTTDDYNLKWNRVDVDKIKEILSEKHDFSSERVDNTLKKLIKQKEDKKQKGLGEWF